MQKSRIRKAGATHLILTLLAGLWFAWPIGFSANQYSLPFQIWMAFKGDCFFILQPQSFIFLFEDRLDFLHHLFGIQVISIVAWILYAISVPLWSFCFGWLFIRTKDWLNHFHVLGRKVF